MSLLKKGSTGSEVLNWQSYLIKQGYDVGALDGIFGQKVDIATRAWQKTNSLSVDGMVGDNSLKKAGLMKIINDKISYYPPQPGFQYPSPSRVREMFGTFKYRNNKGTIQILDNWADGNIRQVEIKCLAGIVGAPKNGIISFHKLAIDQLVGAFDEIVAKNLQDRIISFGGSFYPRFIRGSTTQLSNHSWGSALDLNAWENWLGKQPARLGQRGCLLELVPIFNKWGFFWGGHYKNRLDGMHFEVAKLLN